MKSKKTVKMSYEPEADVLMWELSKQPIDSAHEIGNLVIHFSKRHTPVLVELLEASRFFSEAKHLMFGNGRRKAVA